MQPSPDLRLYRLQQDCVQIAPVQRGIGRAVALHCLLPQGQVSELAPTVAAARDDALWKGGHAVERCPQAPGLQDAGGIGSELQARPHLREGCSLLEKLH